MTQLLNALLFTLFGAVMTVTTACSQDAAAETAEVALKCSCTALGPVVKNPVAYACPNSAPVFQGYYHDKDGNNSWCHALVVKPCGCK